MFSERTMLVFSGLLENIQNKDELINTAKRIDPEIVNSNIKHTREITDYFFNNNRIYDWVNAILNKPGAGNIYGIRNFLQQLENDRYFYNHETKCIESFDRKKHKSGNWGLFSEGDKVYACIARVKLTSNLKRNEQINNAFFTFAEPKISAYNGRIWNFNNGNITAGFFSGDKTESCTEAAIDILLSMIIFNGWHSRSDDYINVQISCASGFINYTNITKNIFGQAVGMINLMDDRMEDNALIIHENLYKQLSPLKRKTFIDTSRIGDEKIYNFNCEIGM